MLNDNREYQKHKRYFNTLNIMSIHLNLTFRILRSDGFDRVLKIWEQVGAPVSELMELLKTEGAELKDKNRECWQWVHPTFNLNILSPEEIKKAINFERQMTFAIWKTPPSNINLFYDELMTYFPNLKTLVQLHYLRLLWKISQGEMKEHVQLVTNPTGLTDQLIMNGKEILVAGAVWLEENYKHLGIGPTSLRLEHYVTKILKNIEFLNNKNLSYEEKSNLLERVRMHPIINKFLLNKKADIAHRVLETVSVLEIKSPDIIDDFHRSEWKKFVEWLIYLNCDQTSLIFKRFRSVIERPRNFKTVLSVRSLTIVRPLYERGDRNTVVCAEWKDTANRSEEHEFDSTCFSFHQIGKEERDEKKDLLLWLRFKDSSLSLEKRCEALQHEIENFLRYFLERGFINQSHIERGFFNQLRHNLQHMPFEDVRKRCELIAQRALQLVIADKAIYSEYNGLDDALIPLILLRDKLLQKDSVEEEEREVNSAKERLADFFQRWKDNPNKRKNSSSYLCIDTPNIISRFSKDSEYPPYASAQIEDTIVTNRVQHTWFDDEDNNKDILVLPVMFHGRKQGVLKLVCLKKCLFIHQDRLRLLNFMQKFEGELYVARLMVKRRELNDELHKALTGNITQSQFGDSICKHIAILLGAVGLSLWWKPTLPGGVLTLIGRIGGVANIFGQDALIKDDRDPFIEEVFLKKEILNINLRNKPGIAEVLWNQNMKGCIEVPVKASTGDILGLMIIHDSDVSPRLSEPFKDELKFLANIVQQIMLHYFEHQGKIGQMREYLAHDLDSALYGITNSTKRLKNIFHSLNLNAENKKSCNQRLGNIDQYAQLCHKLFDAFIEGKSKEGILFDQPDLFLAYVYQARLLEHLERRTSIHAIIHTVLHGKLSLLRNCGITFTQPDTHMLPAFWVHEAIFDRIVNNLVDNIIKYGKPNDKFKVFGVRESANWKVVFENYGHPLGESARDQPETLFENGSQSIPTELREKIKKGDLKGQGMGLYIAQLLCRSFGGDLKLEYKHDKVWSMFSFGLIIPIWLTYENNPWDEEDRR